MNVQDEKDRILVIEDNPDTRRYLETVLSREFDVIAAENAILGIEYARNKKPAVIVLDIVLPILNGYDACSLLKQDDATRRIPIIFLSSKNTVGDIAHGLDLGADDYLPKPFDYKELIARIRARLRDRHSARVEPKEVTRGKLKLVLDSREAFFGTSAVDLTQTEFDILRLLIGQGGRVLSRDEIMKEIWKGDESAATKRVIDVHIRAIRKKIPDVASLIVSVYGEGYKFEG